MRDLRWVLDAAVDGVCWSIPILALIIMILTAQHGTMTP